MVRTGRNVRVVLPVPPLRAPADVGAIDTESLALYGKLFTGNGNGSSPYDLAWCANQLAAAVTAAAGIPVRSR
uniref:hypothetical protein n=1 Tax=Amycolatopsis sp. CA-096443 TaxID=3239919 RepID=UPI003F498652